MLYRVCGLIYLFENKKCLNVLINNNFQKPDMRRPETTKYTGENYGSETEKRGRKEK